MMIDLVSFGIVIDDIVLHDGTTYTGLPGGGGPQTAWGMAAVPGTGKTVGLVASVGEDFDTRLLASMRAAGVDLEGVRRTATATPRAWQYIDEKGSRVHRWQIPPAQSITLGTSLYNLLPENYREARSFHWGLHPENPALADAQHLTAMGKRMSLETFKPPQQPLGAAALRQIVTACTVFSPSWSEAAGMIGRSDHSTVIERFREAGCHMLALRRGAAGAEIWDFKAGQAVRVSAVPTEVIDPVGAGNAFCGAFLAALDQGLAEAACHAAAAASYLLEQFGLPAQLPTEADYQKRVAFARAGMEIIG